jgi:hypothetical protein
MKVAFRLVVAVALIVAALPGTAGATHAPDQSRKMPELFTSGNKATNSDLAFWGKHAFIGYYTGDTGEPAGSGPRGGVRIFDIANPKSPKLVKDLACDANQNDPIVWDRNGNGVADLLLVAVDRTMANPNCGSPRTGHDDRNGWEGVRVFTMSDDPKKPFETITPVDMQYSDCGAHTITAWTGFAEDRENPRLIVYVASYPLRAGPTCGQANFNNTTNPYDDDKVVNDPLHRQIQVLEVPLNNPEDTTEIAAPKISYPGDADGRIEWCERNLCSTPEAPLEPAAVACHDIVTHMEHNIAGAACAEQGQVWEIDPDTGIPDTENPMMIGDDQVSGGDNAQFPGAVDFFHSVMFNNAGTVVNWVDESFGTGCPTMTPYAPRPWNPAGGTHKTGKMFFTDMEGNFLSEFHVGDLRPDPGETEYCSAHMGMAVMGIKRDLLVNAWYTGGADVIDFTNPKRLKEIAYFDPQRDSGTWSAYPYTGPMFKRGAGIPVYASDGVENNALSEGMVVYRAFVQKPKRRDLVDHLNPQTMDHEMMGGGNGKPPKGDDDDHEGDDDGRGKKGDRDRGRRGDGDRGRRGDDDGRGKKRGRDGDDD